MLKTRVAFLLDFSGMLTASHATRMMSALPAVLLPTILLVVLTLATHPAAAQNPTSYAMPGIAPGGGAAYAPNAAVTTNNPGAMSPQAQAQASPSVPGGSGIPALVSPSTAGTTGGATTTTVTQTAPQATTSQTTTSSSIGGALSKDIHNTNTRLDRSAANGAAMTAAPMGGTAPLATPATPSATPSTTTTTTTTTGSANGVPNPPGAGAFSSDPNQLAAQAEQTAMMAQMQADADEAKREQEHNEKSFGRAASGLLPLSPDQIHDFMKKLEQTQDASQPPSSGPPKGQVRIATLSLDPGVDPPQINLAAGYVTTINMVDSSGQPWPILDVGVGGNFEVSPTQAGAHIVRVMPLSRVGSGDLSVLLKDLPTPVIFRLSAGGPNVDLRYDARIGKMGPNGKAPLIDRPRIEAGNESMMQILENAPPNAAKRIKVSGLDARTMAWSLDSHTYVRTPLQLLSPAWDSSIASADGMNVYEIGDAPVLLMSDNGAMVRAQLVRDDDHDK